MDPVDPVDPIFGYIFGKSPFFANPPKKYPKNRHDHFVCAAPTNGALLFAVVSAMLSVFGFNEQALMMAMAFASSAAVVARVVREVQ